MSHQDVALGVWCGGLSLRPLGTVTGWAPAPPQASLLWVFQITSKHAKTLWGIFLAILQTNAENHLRSTLHWLTDTFWRNGYRSPLTDGTSGGPAMHRAEQSFLAQGVLGQTPPFCPTTLMPAQYKGELKDKQLWPDEQMRDPENPC